jgi:cellulose synthase/poly-beta-1,6-N-acetylglucosamine synthase-like glycosyltransferase
LIRKRQCIAASAARQPRGIGLRAGSGYAPGMNPPDPDLPRVTVLTAALNARAALARTVDSVAAQDFADREHVVVDGASTDGTADWLKGLDAPVRWISEPDSGIAAALNKGLALARGDYVLVLQAGTRFWTRAASAAPRAIWMGRTLSLLV